ncbi:MAG TPA: NTP transferase domain-containing protein [Actinomycetota bacterium]
MAELHGLLLTGGTSRRMIVDKATLRFGTSTLAAHAARALVAIADPVLAVGHEAGTGLETVDDPKEGPLVALVVGADELAARGATGPIVLLGCDIPLISPHMLSHIAAALDGHDAAVPDVDGRPQPMVGCYAQSAIAVARDLVAREHRAMHELLAHIDLFQVRDWHDAGGPEELIDVDTPEDLEEARHHAGYP